MQAAPPQFQRVIIHFIYRQDDPRLPKEEPTEVRLGPPVVALFETNQGVEGYSLPEEMWDTYPPALKKKAILDTLQKQLKMTSDVYLDPKMKLL